MLMAFQLTSHLGRKRRQSRLEQIRPSLVKILRRGLAQEPSSVRLERCVADDRTRLLEHRGKAECVVASVVWRSERGDVRVNLAEKLRQDILRQSSRLERSKADRSDGLIVGKGGRDENGSFVLVVAGNERDLSKLTLLKQLVRRVWNEIAVDRRSEDESGISTMRHGRRETYPAEYCGTVETRC